VERVGVMVDPDDATLETWVRAGRLSIVQLHGNEPVARVEAVRERFGVKVMKVIRIAEAADLDGVAAYEPVADWLMFDAKPPREATRPGGNAVAFDWRLLAGRTWQRPWLLAGGLDVGNVKEAATLTGARFVDVSSGVESRPGVKDPALIRAFLETVRDLI
ncbi:MAG: phosphoribosylanthranilate isomerase, partial [Proteobacteria bacterium]|nr:phosphoribosylanthranilate isomerase [Pseudomonadota bacterium]